MNKHIDVSTLAGVRDGSPKGNWYIGTGFIDLAVCPDKRCPALGLSIKCQSKDYAQCNTYIRRNDIEAFELEGDLGPEEDHGLVDDVTNDDIF